MKTAIIICSRTDSNRVPNKPFKKIAGRYIIDHLLVRLKATGIPIVVAVPESQLSEYSQKVETKGITLMGSEHHSDVLKRMSEAAKLAGCETVVRITHDKILLDHADIFSALDCFNRRNLDYLYSSHMTDGCGFEIISANTLHQAAAKFDNVEHISYAIRAQTKNMVNFTPSKFHEKSFRFLIDYPEDVRLFEVLFSALGPNATARECVAFLKKNPEIKKINQLPRVTVYTCAHNAEEYIARAMISVAGQIVTGGVEYIIIDDASTDKTCEIIAKHGVRYKNVHWKRNEKNLGLSSSSNIAIKEARGKYIVRLDADDYFLNRLCVQDLACEIEQTGKEIVYPNNYFGEHGVIQKGKDSHHVGGAIFRKSALNYIKFTEGLRGHEGLDLFLRAKDQLSIGYLNKPIFFYTQRPDSMSKTNLKNRDEIKAGILEKYKHGEA